eukprot:8060253-Pyramimonas_sp.AAC.1
MKRQYVEGWQCMMGAAVEAGPDDQCYWILRLGSPWRAPAWQTGWFPTLHGLQTLPRAPLAVQPPGPAQLQRTSQRQSAG